MPLKLNIGLSRKIGEANYGSRGASVNLELELESVLVNDPARLRERIRQSFDLIRTSLDEELNGGNTSNGDHGENGTSNGQDKARPATQSQVKAIYAIARDRGLKLTPLLRDRFQLDKPEGLSLKQASSLIDELKRNGKGG